MPNIYLAHHGIKGQKWGVRRWQNADGSLTPAGREHYGVGEARNAARETKTGSTKKAGDISLAKGYQVSRITGVENKKFKNPIGTYVYTDADESSYKYFADVLPSVARSKNPDVALVTTYELSRNARVMSGHDAVNKYMDMFGERKLRDFYKDDGQLISYAASFIRGDLDSSVKDRYTKLNGNNEGISRRAKAFSHRYLQYDMQQLDSKNSSSHRKRGATFTNAAKKLGYDAIVDPEDWSDFAEMPLIVLNRRLLKEKDSNVRTTKSLVKEGNA